MRRKTEGKNDAGKESHRRRGKIFSRLVMGLALLLLVLLLAVGVAGVALYKSGEASLRASVSTQAPAMERDWQSVENVQGGNPPYNVVAWQEDWVVYEGGAYEYSQETLNFLLLGIDRAGTLKKETDLSNWNAGQADALFLVSLDTENKKMSIIGIPRNSMVELEIYNEVGQCNDTLYNQICLQYGYAGGGELGLETTKKRVSELFCQLPIHGVCAISFHAIEIITDMLGGIEVTVPDEMAGYGETLSFQEGFAQGSRMLLTGETVCDYLRYRDLAVLGSPTVRLTRQKEFLKDAIGVVFDKVHQNFALVGDIYKAVVPYMNTDITLDEAVYLAAWSKDCQVEDCSFYQLTGEDRKVDYIKEDGTPSYFDDYYLDEEALKKIMIEVFYKRVVMEEK